MIYGVSGTNGSGKDSLGELLAVKFDCKFISVTDLLREEAKRRGEPIEREVLRTISAEWRREHGLGVLVDKAVELYEQEGGNSKYKGLAIASLRNPGEADRVHELGGKVVWTDADPQVRYQRIYSRQRTAEDDKTFEQFLAEQEEEMSYSGDEATLSTGAIKPKSDVYVTNNFDTLEEFESAVEQIFAAEFQQ